MLLNGQALNLTLVRYRKSCFIQKANTEEKNRVILPAISNYKNVFANEKEFIS